MRFEIRYPTGSPHQVERQGTLITLGRDPGCDLVISDVKCSRRHAVIEVGAQGLTIRDTGSANGVFVNAKRVERSSLEPGDLIRVGEVFLKVLPEETTGTVVMGPDELELADIGRTPPPEDEGPKAPPAAPAQRSGPRSVTAPARRPVEALRTDGARVAPGRPLTVTVLAVLWLVSLPLFLGGGLIAAARGGWTGLAPLATAALGIVVAVIAATMGIGLMTMRPWARPLQIGIAGLGLLLCPFSLASATVLLYMLREEARLYFSGKRVPARGEAARATELTFSLSLLGMVAVGALLTGLAAWLAFGRRP